MQTNWRQTNWRAQSQEVSQEHGSLGKQQFFFFYALGCLVCHQKTHEFAYYRTTCDNVRQRMTT